MYIEDIKEDSLWLMKGDCLERMKEIPDGSVDFHIGEKELDLLVGVYELVMEKGGSATLEDVVGVKVGVDKRHNPQPLVKRGVKRSRYEF